MKRAYLYMHIAILLWGFTGIFGRAINMGYEHIVWYRMMLSSLSLLLILKFNKQFVLLPSKEVWRISLVGIVVMIHWILFYAAIKVSNVSITLACFSSVTLFTAIIEPIINKRRIDLFEIIFALIVMAGIYTIFAFQKVYVAGIILSLLSALFGSIFTIYNKRFLETHDAGLITFYELFTGFIFLSIILTIYLNITSLPFQLPSSIDWLYLLLLSVICTTIAFTISLIALKQLNPFIMNLSVNLEPVYSIVLAILIFNEGKFLNAGFYIGTSVILLAVFIHGIHQWYLSRIKNKQIASAKAPDLI
ncbi:MAG: DMT family transporter [Bacteroidia bacterium]